jgi:3-oxoacyl-[acyl-carrier protein] reductase
VLVDIRRKVGLISGSAQGLGRAFALKLAELGVVVVCVDLNEEKLNRVRAEISEKGGTVRTYQADIVNEKRINQIVGETVAEFGRLDVLINNASVFSSIKMRPFDEIPLDEWNIVTQVQLNGMFNLTKAVSPHMKKARSGQIINISSNTIFSGRPFYLHYVTAKSAVIGFTRGLAKEMGEFGVRANCVTLGPVMTEVPRETVSSEQWKHLISLQCIHEQARPEYIADVIAFLCSEESRWITGQIINVDAGMSMP